VLGDEFVELLVPVVEFGVLAVPLGGPLAAHRADATGQVLVELLVRLLVHE